MALGVLPVVVGEGIMCVAWVFIDDEGGSLAAVLAVIQQFHGH